MWRQPPFGKLRAGSRLSRRATQGGVVDGSHGECVPAFSSINRGNLKILPQRRFEV
jgi:hypothetical protein